MKHKILFATLLSLCTYNAFAQLPKTIEVTNCVYSANDMYVVGQDVEGCQCFDRLNGNDRIAVWTQANFPDNQAFVFEAGRTCADGAPVLSAPCLREDISEYCHIIDSHGSPGCNNCIVTIVKRVPCLDTIRLNNIIIPQDTYQSTQKIISNGIVDASTEVAFKSNEILFEPGFEVVTPSFFKALIEPDECDNYFCPPFEDAPTFLQALPDLNVNSDENCDATIQIPFQIDYAVPNNLSAFAYALDQYFNYFMIEVELASVNGSISNFVLSETIPLGTYEMYLEIKDSNCNLSVTENLNIVVSNSGMIPTFICKDLAIPISDSLDVIVKSSDIVCVTDPNACDPSSNQDLISSFSYDPTDNTRIYDCEDLGNVQVNMYTWDVLDQDGNGVLDTIFRQICFAVQTIYDPNNYCNP